MTQIQTISESIVPVHVLVHGGTIVSVKLPKKLSVKDQVTVSDGTILSYLHYPVFYAKGAAFNVHLYGADVSLAGTRINARADVMKKVMSDGREYLYLDLYPVDDEATAKFIPLDDRRFQSQSTWQTFSMPESNLLLAFIGRHEEYPAPTLGLPQAKVVHFDPAESSNAFAALGAMFAK